MGNNEASKKFSQDYYDKFYGYDKEFPKYSLIKDVSQETWDTALRVRSDLYSHRRETALTLLRLRAFQRGLKFLIGTLVFFAVTTVFTVFYNPFKLSSTSENSKTLLVASSGAFAVAGLLLTISLGNTGKQKFMEERIAVSSKLLEESESILG